MANQNPDLTNAMREIDLILIKYDLMGLTCLADGIGNGEYVFGIEKPSWSNFKFLPDGRGIHFKGYAESDRMNTEKSVNAFMNLADLSQSGSHVITELGQLIEKQMDIVKEKGTFY